jgi:hypothetical protein
MKSLILQLLAVSPAAAIVFPDLDIFAQLPIEENQVATTEESYLLGTGFPSLPKAPKLPSLGGVVDGIKKPFKHVADTILAKDSFDYVLDKATKEEQEWEKENPENVNDETDEFGFNNHGLHEWMENGESESLEEMNYELDGDSEQDMEAEGLPRWLPKAPHPPFEHGPPGSGPPDHPPHGPPGHGPPGPPGHGPPEHGPPGHGPPGHGPPGHGPPGHGPPGKRPGPPKHCPPHHGKPHKPPHHHPHKFNETIFELISKSNYTKNFTALIEDDAELVSLLNSTKVNSTVFVPLDWAFKKIPKNLPKPPKEAIAGFLRYHILNGTFSGLRLVLGKTSPTLYEPPNLGGPQRVAVHWWPFKGLVANLGSRIIAPNLVSIMMRVTTEANKGRSPRMVLSTASITSCFHPHQQESSSTCSQAPLALSV